MSSIAIGNIFDIVSETKEESFDLRMRSNLMIAIRDIVNMKAWNKNEAASYIGIHPQLIANIYGGKIENLQTELLLKTFLLSKRYVNNE